MSLNCESYSTTGFPKKSPLVPYGPQNKLTTLESSIILNIATCNTKKDLFFYSLTTPKVITPEQTRSGSILPPFILLKPTLQYKETKREQTNDNQSINQRKP